MELIGSLLVILALIVLVAVFVGRPFLVAPRKGQPAGLNGASSSDHERSSLLAERDRALSALQELDFDYSLGKIPAEDYPAHRAILLRAGAESLRRLDKLESETSAAERGSAEDRIEAAVMARRADSARRAEPQYASQAVGAAGLGKDAIEDMVAARKRQRGEKSAGFCPGCGKPVQKSDQFCSKCGRTL